jgi:hypothetical protein
VHAQSLHTLRAWCVSSRSRSRINKLVTGTPESQQLLIFQSLLSGFTRHTHSSAPTPRTCVNCLSLSVRGWGEGRAGPSYTTHCAPPSGEEKKERKGPRYWMRWAGTAHHRDPGAALPGVCACKCSHAPLSISAESPGSGEAVADLSRLSRHISRTRTSRQRQRQRQSGEPRKNGVLPQVARKRKKGN